MKSIDELMLDAKNNMENIEVPDEMESRLSNALRNIPEAKRKTGRWRSMLAAACIVLLLVGYNMDTLAYYGKKLIGYDTLMSSTLKKLNDQEKGQLIEESYTFSNGVTLTLDGVMLDANQLLVFYTIKTPNGSIEDVDVNGPMFIKGSIGEYISQSGHGEMNDDRTEIKWIQSFNPPLFFEKSLKLMFGLRMDDAIEQGEISFKLDRNKAMGYTLKKHINQSVEVDETDIAFDTITASPTSTVVSGSIRSIASLAIDKLRGERFRLGSLSVKLYVNGNETASQGGSMGTDMKGMHFSFEYDALPENVETLQIELVSFAADHDVNKQYELQIGDKEQTLNILGQEIVVNDVRVADGNTYITITTEESTVLTRVYLLADENQLELENTSGDQYDKLPGMLLHTRTLCFKGIGEKLKLDLKRMSYTKQYNKIIDIPIE